MGRWGGLLDALAGFAVGFGLLFVLWAIGGGGGGDVKLMGAVGAWLGPYQMLMVFIYSAAVVVVLWFFIAVGRLVSGRPVRPAATKAGDKQERTIGRLFPYALPATVAIWLRLAQLALTDQLG